mmetsp:Transcript_5569/g.7635  ORF Transcript_5569/g.7635 Transcript_5569/m.7635 type:complete len:384 (-) Transcript_5569:345-1496(-)
MVTSPAKTSQRAPPSPRSASTPPIVLKRNQSSTTPLSLPWDEEVHTRLEQEEGDTQPIFSLEADCDEDEETSSDQSASSLSSSAPIERKCVLQNSALTAMIAQTNAMLMLDEIQWIYHHPNFLHAPQCPIPSFATPQKDVKGITFPYQDVPFDCDDNGESDEQEEDIHSHQRLNTLHEVERYIDKAVQRSNDMAAIAKSVERIVLEARLEEERYHYSNEGEVGSHACHQQRRKSDYLDNQSQTRNTRTKRRTKSRPTQSMPKQALLLVIKTILILILTFFTIVSTEVVLSISMEKGRIIHSFFLELSHDHLFTVWDLVAVGMMLSVTTLDAAMISTLVISKRTSGSGLFWNKGEEEECEHPMIDEIRVVEIEKRSWVPSFFSG